MRCTKSTLHCFIRNRAIANMQMNGVCQSKMIVRIEWFRCSSKVAEFVRILQNTVNIVAKTGLLVFVAFLQMTSIGLEVPKYPSYVRRKRCYVR